MPTCAWRMISKRTKDALAPNVVAQSLAAIVA
jgi:hypothetical protein